MKPLRILHTESSTGLGGQELRILSEASGMARRGHTVTLAVSPEGRLRELAERQGLQVETITLRKSRYVPLVLDFLDVIRRHSIQLVNTHGSLDSWTASVAGRVSRQTPIIIRTRHKSTPVSRSFRHRILYQWLPHGIITTGESTRRELIISQEIDPTRITSIPTGVDLERYRPDLSDGTLRSAFGVLPKHFLVGTVAFLRSYKGLNYFLESASLVTREHPEARFLIVGDGPEETALWRKIEELGLSSYVTLFGYREDIPRVLATMDAFVLPSVEAEGLPQALTQAMAMERPVVTTAVGGITEAVEHGVTGLLVAPRDPQGLAESVSLLVREPALRMRLARAGRDLIVKSYSLEAMLDRTEDLYARLLDLDGYGGRLLSCSEDVTGPPLAS